VKKIYKYILSTILVVFILKLPSLKNETFDISAIFGLIMSGIVYGSIIYLIFGRKKKIKK